MRSFLTDDNNDLYLDGTNQIATGDDNEAILQIVKNNLRTLRGELQLDIDAGVPYLETILSKTPDVELWKSYMIEEAEKVDGVLKVENMDIEIDEGVISYTMEITTEYGTGIVEG